MEIDVKEIKRLIKPLKIENSKVIKESENEYTQGIRLVKNWYEYNKILMYHYKLKKSQIIQIKKILTEHDYIIICPEKNLMEIHYKYSGCPFV